MLQQLIVKLQLPSTITLNEDITFELIGYKFDPNFQLVKLKQKRNIYDQKSIGSIIQIVKGETQQALKKYQNKDWNIIQRPLSSFTFEVQLIVHIKEIKQPSINIKSLQTKQKMCLSHRIALNYNNLPSSDKLAEIIIKEASSFVQQFNQKTFKPSNQLISLTPQKIYNPHLFIKTNQKEKFVQYYAKGIYEYYHYSDQSFHDHGWGCAYRSLQTILSWLNLQNHCKIPKMFTLTEIQEIIDLINIGSDRRIKNTCEWIGATEVSWVVKKISNYDCRIIHVADGKNIIEHCQMFRDHFERVGCPIMYGGGQYAYSIVGLNYSWQLGECQFLILDPHYPGTDSLDKILQKKGLAWRKPQQMFKKGIFYNFCLPMIPQIQ